MKGYHFIDEDGTFVLEQPEETSYLYFPIAGEQGLKSSLTPSFGGDAKLSQNEFLLQPVSAEELHNNKSTRNFWCHIPGGISWSATGCSSWQKALRFTGKEEQSTLEAGMLWQKVIRSSKDYPFRSEVLSFVPATGSAVELMLVKIVNDKTEPVTFLPTAAVPIFGRSADNLRDHRHVTSLLHQIDTISSGVVVQPSLSFDERGHKINQRLYYVCGFTGTGELPTGFFPIAEDFIGEGGSYEWPRAVVENLQPCGSQVHKEGYEAAGAIRFAETVLKPGESKSFILLIGSTEQREEIEQVQAEYGTEEKVLHCLEETKQYWRRQQNIQYHTSDANFDQFMQWVSIQPVLRRIYGCSFLPHHDYGRGGRGWRDLWQDCLALLIQNPDGVRELLHSNIGGVRMDGTNATIIGEAPGEFIADRNHITRVWMDHGFWPLFTIGFYLDQTGDYELLLKQAPYFKDPQIMRGTEQDSLWESGQGNWQKDQEGTVYYGTVLEHLLLENLTAFYETGEHNHIRLRGGDWNDALDMAWERGESVTFSAAYAGNLETLSGLLQKLKQKLNCEEILIAEEIELLLQTESSLFSDTERKNALLHSYCDTCRHQISGEKISVAVSKIADCLHKMAEWQKGHIRQEEFLCEGEEGWFNGYYDNHGNAVEGNFPLGVRMTLTGQVFPILSGTATEEQISKITASANHYLYCQELGGYRLNTDFKERKTDLGRMFGFAYGHKENGAVFSHMAVMYANALYRRGFVREGYQALNSLYRQAMNFERSRIYPGIPEYFNTRGRGMYHYLTGAASWYLMTVVTEMFGAEGMDGALCLSPKLLPEQFDVEGKAEISFTFAGHSWHVIYRNEQYRAYEDYRIADAFLDGARLEVGARSVRIPAEQMIKLSKEQIHEVAIALS